MAQGIIIGLTDNSDRYVWQIVNQFLRRATKPTKGEKRFTVTAWIMLGITILLVIAFLISGFNSIFGWLVIGAIFGFIPLVIALYIWRVRDIIKQINPLRQQEKTT